MSVNVSLSNYRHSSQALVRYTVRSPGRCGGRHAEERGPQCSSSPACLVQPTVHTQRMKAIWRCSSGGQLRFHSSSTSSFVGSHWADWRPLERRSLDRRLAGSGDLWPSTEPPDDPPILMLRYTGALPDILQLGISVAVLRSLREHRPTNVVLAIESRRVYSLFISRSHRSCQSSLAAGTALRVAMVVWWSVARQTRLASRGSLPYPISPEQREEDELLQKLSGGTQSHRLHIYWSSDLGLQHSRCPSVPAASHVSLCRGNAATKTV